ncbi:VWA domain-containing protein [Acidicapsa ligni]|uniref:VWA domain-containing protein n=1 Tax=Acidicapsa ligni TaxID=542300 RepID=UPI0021DF765E|nr:VWA domain-containing protein [Acidicapsa ligni]
MPHCTKLLTTRFFAGPLLILMSAGLSALPLTGWAAQSTPAAGRQTQSTAPLTIDRDPVRSPDAPASTIAADDTVAKTKKGFILRSDVEEVSLNVTVLDNSGHIVQDLKGENFKVQEDGVQQALLSFQHQDIPVSIGLVVDNSGSMFKKRPAVNKSTLDLILASNPKDEAFVVNFADDAYIDQEFTSDVNKLRDGLSHLESRGGTALYDAVVASADKLAADAKRPKQVIVIITDGEDNASTLNLEQAIRRVQQLSGPVIYTIGLLFGDEMSHSEVRHARRALEMLSGETGGIAFFPKSLDQVDEIAAEVARDIRSQYTLGYHSTKPSTEPGFRKITVLAQAKGEGKLVVRTRTGYFPTVKNGATPGSTKPPASTTPPTPTDPPSSN